MTDRIPIREVVLVEGKYDKITLSQVIDATIMTTEGFGIFHNSEKRAMLVRMAEKNGVLLLTDSDGGGTQIRAFLSGVLPSEKIHHLYVPRIEGKERRKRTASRSGILGVEGMKTEILRHLFEPFRADVPHEEKAAITQTDLFEAGLLGGENAVARRRALCDRLSLPPLTGKQLLGALNSMITRDVFLTAVKELDTDL